MGIFLFFGFSLIFLIFAIFGIGNIETLIQSGIKITGKVVAYRIEEDSCFATVQFITKDNLMIQKEVSVNNAYSIGSEYDIKYSKNKPSNFILVNEYSATSNFLFLMIGIIMFSVSIILILD